METAFPQCPIRTDWKALYRAAIYETDGRVGSQKVAEAEKAVLVREREIFYAEGTLEEKDALEDALYCLRALKCARQHTIAA
jgi:hypothetical protein